MAAATYSRLLIKLSGEALMGRGECGIDLEVLNRLADEIRAVAAAGVQIGLVIGGGNLVRGAALARAGMDRVTGDHMGMLATVINALAMQEALAKQGLEACVLSAVQIGPMCEDYSRRRALEHLEKGRVVLFAAGTGNPFFTTDSAAALRAIEIKAQLMIKATQAGGVYSADPRRVGDAVLYDRLDYDEVLRQKLEVMDATAIVLCRDHGLPLRVCNIHSPGVLLKIARGESVGTLVDRQAGEEQT